MEDIYLTREGYEKLSKELDCLKNLKRREISKAIGEARLLGDLSENAEYDSAKEAQAMNEKRISELEDTLSRSRIIEEESVDTSRARIGATVKLKDLDFPDEFEYTLVSEAEADYEHGKISVSSPVGRALLGRKVGDKLEIAAPARTLHYEILDISR